MTLEYVPKHADLKYVQVLFWSDMTEIKLRKAFLLSSAGKKKKKKKEQIGRPSWAVSPSSSTCKNSEEPTTRSTCVLTILSWTYYLAKSQMMIFKDLLS